MGECHCSKIAIMQLFHELKQQFPALPDYVVSQCIAQNSHDRETCARSLRATQESRPPPGAFPPPPPQPESMTSSDRDQHPTNLTMSQDQAQPNHQPIPTPAAAAAAATGQQSDGIHRRSATAYRAHRPVSLDIGTNRRVTTGQSAQPQQQQVVLAVHPSSAPAACANRGFFEDLGNASGCQAKSSFELNVNVACSPAANRDYPGANAACEETCSTQQLQPQQQQQQQQQQGAAALTEPTTRSFTSVSLTLRPPSSEPQPPIDISSQGSSLTYSSSSLDPRGFQSRLQISIGRGGAGGVAAARIKPPPAPAPQQRPNSLVTLVHNPSGANRPPGLPVGPPSQLPRPTTTMSAPTTPSGPAKALAAPPSSLPTTPLTGPSTALGAIPRTPQPSSGSVGSSDRQTEDQLPPEFLAILDQVEDEFKPLVTEQLIRKDRLAKALEAEKDKLETMRKEIEELSQPTARNISPKEYERQLRSEIYQLQLECDKLAEEVDRNSDRQIPLGETNEEFYQDIYTGQQYVPQSSEIVPPPLPSQPPAWEPASSGIDNQEEADGPSWVCQRCTFDNHPLMNNCEQCDMPRLIENAQGTRIRSTNQQFIRSLSTFPSTSR